MAACLNIGLIRSKSHAVDPGKPVDVSVALKAVDVLTQGNLPGARVYMSDTEPTLVVFLYEPLSTNQLATLAHTLGQDCVAQYVVEGGKRWGVLAGPKAEDWGPFNPEYFILFDGRRAAEPVPVAA